MTLRSTVGGTASPCEPLGDATLYASDVGLLVARLAPPTAFESNSPSLPQPDRSMAPRRIVVEDNLSPRSAKCMAWRPFFMRWDSLIIIGFRRHHKRRRGSTRMSWTLDLRRDWESRPQGTDSH